MLKPLGASVQLLESVGETSHQPWYAESSGAAEGLPQADSRKLSLRLQSASRSLGPTYHLVLPAAAPAAERKSTSPPAFWYAGTPWQVDELRTNVPQCAELLQPEST